jgi:hypothetical protein
LDRVLHPCRERCVLKSLDICSVCSIRNCNNGTPVISSSVTGTVIEANAGDAGI